jgi:hypothetical protein
MREAGGAGRMHANAILSERACHISASSTAILGFTERYNFWKQVFEFVVCVTLSRMSADCSTTSAIRGAFTQACIVNPRHYTKFKLD